MYIFSSQTLSALSLFFTLTIGISVSGGEPVQDVQTALEGMHDWLGSDENAAPWRRFLLSEELEIQLVQGPHATSEIVAEIHAIYAGDTPGLEQHQFVKVRQALREWLDELTSSRDGDIAAAAQAARGQFTSVDQKRIAEVRQSVRDATDELEQFLGGGSEQNGRHWKKYLKWDLLKDQLSDGSAAKLESLVAVLSQYFSGAEGLELPQFARVRRALARYYELLVLANDPNASETFANRLDALAKHLEVYSQRATVQTAGEIGLNVQWLEGVGQTSELVNDIRRRYSRPNLIVRVSAAAISAAVDRPITEPTSIREVILGTRIRGQGITHGELKARLVPSAREAAVDVTMVGTTTSDTFGRNGPVTIKSTGETTLEARARLLIGPAGIQVAPADAHCETRTRIHWISAGQRLGGRLIESIAWNRARQDQRRVESIASRRAERRLKQRMDRESQKMAQDANQRYTAKILNPLRKAAVFPQILRVASTRQDIRIQAVQANPWQLAAPGPPPESPADAEITARVHESLFNNSAETVLAGMTLTDERLVELLKESNARVPEELEITPDKDPWAITFMRRHPIIVEFNEDRVKIAIRGRRFLRGEQTLERPVEISATYSLAIGQLGVQMNRLGDVEVTFLNSRGRLSTLQIGYKTFMRRKFSALFEEKFELEGVKLPENLQQRLGQLVPRHVDANNGWLSVAWNRVPQEKIAAAGN